MTNTNVDFIVNSMLFADSTAYTYTRFELVEMKSGKVLFLDVEGDEYADYDDDSFEDRWKIGEEVKLKSLDFIVEEGIKRGYFIEADGYDVESGELMFESEDRSVLEQMEKWLGIEEIF